MSQARIIVIGNEKGGAGKSTIAVHLVAALLHEGARVCVVDLDIRQQSTAHFFSNRAAWTKSQGAVLPAPQVLSGADPELLDMALGAAALGAAGREQGPRWAGQRPGGWIKRCPAWWGADCLSPHQGDGTGPGTRWTGA